MVNFLVKNRTPYRGKLKLKFEKSPHYTGHKSGKLNKIHLDLGFTKLVTRMIPYKNEEAGWDVDPKRIELIERYTGGKIASHNVDKNTETEFILHNSFMGKNGEYIGDVEIGWWYYENNMIVCDDYPRGVAIKVKPELFKKAKGQIDSYMDSFIEGYYGYTHRGGSLFKIGDRIFEPGYTPVEEDYPEWQWAGLVEKFNESMNKAIAEKDDFWIKDLHNDGISSITPFRLRGRKEIENWSEALEAAINMSKYL